MSFIRLIALRLHQLEMGQKKILQALSMVLESSASHQHGRPQLTNGYANSSPKRSSGLATNASLFCKILVKIIHLPRWQINCPSTLIALVENTTFYNKSLIVKKRQQNRIEVVTPDLDLATSQCQWIPS